MYIEMAAGAGKLDERLPLNVSYFAFYFAAREQMIAIHSLSRDERRTASNYEAWIISLVIAFG